MYVSDNRGHCIVVYETSGQFVTSFGGRGQKEGKFQHPDCITSCANGFIRVCDWDNKRVQIFNFDYYLPHAIIFMYVYFVPLGSNFDYTLNVKVTTAHALIVTVIIQHLYHTNPLIRTPEV